MSRIIMLIPLDKNVGLTSISLSIIYFFNQNKLKNQSFKSILYFSCIKRFLGDTSFIINKHFSNIVHISDKIDFSKILFGSNEYFILLNEMIEECYSKKSLYELILIEGIHNDYSMHAQNINYDIAQNLSAEVICITNLKNNSLKCIHKKTKEIELFLKQKEYKSFLGVIFNNIYSPFIETSYNFIQKLIILKNFQQDRKEIIIKKKEFKNNIFSIIGCIPWNKKILKTYVIDIYNFLNIDCLYLVQKKLHIIEEIIIFDESYSMMLHKKYLNTLMIVSFSRINVFIKMFNLLNINNNKISSIIITGALESKKNIASVCNVLINRELSIFFTKKSTIDIFFKLENFDFNIYVKNKEYIEILQKYISNFFCSSSLINHKLQNHNNIRYSPQEFCSYLKLLSRKKNKRIILPESYEYRILEAVSICHNYNIAQCVLLGDPKKIYAIADNYGIKLSKNIEIINPNLIRDKYITRLVELRHSKGIDSLMAQKQLQDNIVLATLILESNEVDGLVSGSVNTTSNTIRPALQIIKTNLNSSLVSSIFFMLLPNQVLIYGDCAININPTSEELAEIAIQSADSSKMFGIEPRIAMLSYSTGYSGSGKQVEKVRNATFLVQNRRPDLIIEGPIQYDAAVSRTVSQLKAPYSLLAGSANIFIFPDLNAGNIAYKAVQRSGKIVSIGPILQGLRKPVNDLSRGSSVQDIVYTIALTAIQAV